jgi:Ser/Thr protein kinase RdoA (MazF antagonist)
LAQSLVKKNELFIYLFHQENSSAWVVFYNPIQIKNKLPRRLDEKQIRKLGRELARFHKACTNVSNQLPNASKTVITDIQNLIKSVNKNEIKMCENHKSMVLKHADLFLNNAYKAYYTEEIETIPVFIDWNIGNFSVTPEGKFYSRWDYDWFRMSSRVMDFYFFSRVVSDIGDRTVFSYLVDTLMEDRFIAFLKEYHRIFPLTEPEVHLIIEAYRFFILNYVIKDGPYFFRQIYSSKLVKEAYDTYFPAIGTNYNVDKILRALKL